MSIKDGVETFPVLLIFELIPEETKMYTLHLTQKQVNRFSKVNGLICNADEFTDEQSAIFMEISDRVSVKPEYCVDQEAKYNCRWARKQVHLPKGELAPMDIKYIIRTGLYL